MAYLTTMLVAQTTYSRKIELLMNDDLERIRKEGVLALFKFLLRHLSGDTEENVSA